MDEHKKLNEMNIDDIFNMSRDMAKAEKLKKYVDDMVKSTIGSLTERAVKDGDPKFMEEVLIIASYVNSKQKTSDMMFEVIKESLSEREDEIIREGE